jgi:hypothetical protein
MVKKCIKCEITQYLDQFAKEPRKRRKDQYHPVCKTCKAIYDREYREKNKEKLRKKKKIYAQKNAIKINTRSRKYAIENWAQILKYKQNWSKKKKLKDMNYRISCILRTRLNKAIKGKFKTGSAVNDLGCSIEQLLIHLESQFYNHPTSKIGMSWENYGQNGWNIDHIKPFVSFNLTNYEELQQACHYTNLRPIWVEEHTIKSAKERRNFSSF